MSSRLQQILMTLNVNSLLCRQSRVWCDQMALQFTSLHDWLTEGFHSDVIIPVVLLLGLLVYKLVYVSAEKLTGDAKLRYFDKIKLVNNTDPYSLSTASLSTTSLWLPTIKRPDLYNHLILQYTSVQFQAFRLLEAYKQMR